METAFNWLLLSTFVSAFNLPLGRALLIVTLAIIIADCIKKKNVPKLPATAWMALLFFISASISTFAGVNPAEAGPKLRKLLWYSAIPIYAILVNSPKRLSVTLASFAGGTGALAVWITLRNAWKAYADVKADPALLFSDVMITLGSMTDAQRLMVGILISTGGLILIRKKGASTMWWWILLTIQASALLLTFKRGSLICLILSLGLYVVSRLKVRYVAAFLALFALILLFPSQRQRIFSLRDEFNPDKGGRMTMWFRVAPVIHKQYPWMGIGWRALTNEMMIEAHPKTEKNRNHLHSNIAEIIVETGWIGFAIYSLWMLKILYDAVFFAHGSRKNDDDDPVNSFVLLMAITALLLNGLVEFNFADGEIVLIFSMVAGCAAAGLKRLDFKPMGIRFNLG